MNLLLRIGPFGQIGRFRSPLDFKLKHGQKVICRTARGLEVGEYLSHESPITNENGAGPADAVIGELVRTLTSQDELLAGRLNQNRIQAISECQKLIDERGLDVAILDAELTFDGQRLYFYFSGESSPEIDEVTDSLAETFDAHVRFSEFAESLQTGCGPDCGTSAGSCHESGCSSCSLKSNCKATN